MIRFYTHKKHKKNTRHQKQQKELKAKNYNQAKAKKQISEQKLKMRLKTSKGKKVAYLHKNVSTMEILIQLNL